MKLNEWDPGTEPKWSQGAVPRKSRAMPDGTRDGAPSLKAKLCIKGGIQSKGLEYLHLGAEPSSKPGQRATLG